MGGGKKARHIREEVAAKEIRGCEVKEERGSVPDLEEGLHVIRDGDFLDTMEKVDEGKS